MIRKKVRSKVRQLAAAMDDIVTLVGRSILIIILAGTILIIIPQGRAIPILMALTLAHRLERWFTTWPDTTPSNLKMALDSWPIYPLVLLCLAIAISLILDVFKRRE